MVCVLVRGSGDVGSAVAHALFLAGYAVVVHDNPRPGHPRRGMAFTDSLFDGSAELEGVLAKRARTVEDVRRMVQCRRAIPVADAGLHEVLGAISPEVVVDARMRKRSTPEIQTGLAPLTIGLGPNFEAGTHTSIVIETAWGSDLGRIIDAGRTRELSGQPRDLGGHGRERFVYSPTAGVFRTSLAIGERVTAGQEVGRIDTTVVCAPLTGRLRGLAHDGVRVEAGAKLVEVDARDDDAIIRGLGERPRRIAQGVLTAVDRQLQRAPAAAQQLRTEAKAFGVGAAIGTLGGLIGLGGAEFRLPALAALFSFPVRRAIVANVLISLVTVVAALAFRLASQGPDVLQANLASAVTLLGGSLAGAFLGAGLAARVRTKTLAPAVGILLAALGVLIALHGTLALGQVAIGSATLLFGIGSLAGLGIGVVASVLGVAGGELLIPALVLLYGLDLKLAGTVSLAISAPTLAVALLRYRSIPDFRAVLGERRFLAAMALGSIAGAYAGSQLIDAVPSAALGVLLGLILVGSALKTFRR